MMAKKTGISWLLMEIIENSRGSLPTVGSSQYPPSIEEHDFKTLEDHVLVQVDTLKGNAEETNNEVEARFIRLEDMIQAVHESIEGMREDLTLCKEPSLAGVLTMSPPRGLSAPSRKGSTGQGTPRKKHADIERGACWLDTWDEFKKEINKHFYHENVVYEACKKLWKLKQRGIMRDYVKEFTTLMLQIPNMSEDDLLFYFIDEVQGWAKQEIHRRDIRTVDEAIVIAESLVDFQPYSHTNTMKNKDKYPAKGGGEWWENNQGNRDRDHRRPQAKEGDRDRRPGLRDYEEKKKAFVPKRDIESQAEIGSLQVLNALKAKSLTPTPSNGLMYVEAVINEKLTRVMVDTGATHNFVSKDKANRLGLKYIGTTGWLKTENTQTVTAIPMPSFSSVCILEKGSPCMIPMVEAPKEQCRDAKQLSAIQLGRGIKKGAMTYLAMLKKDDEIKKTDDLPPIIREVLEENKDVIPPELPNKLPPRREVDHKIELEPGAKSSALAPHRMAQPELEELRRLYEWLFMPFGLTNALATFCTLMNKLFQPYLDQFMVVYLDDIVVYSNSIEEHIDHLRIVFKKLRENELYVKKEKCTFSTEEEQFFGHVIDHGKLLIDGNKIKAITEWEPPTKVSEMRSFLGLVNYYRQFIQGYSTRASPLTDLLKKGKAWEWVYTDASDFAIGGVLMQEGHPIAFESRKLNDTKTRYMVQEKEMTTIIHCLRIWRHYLLGAHFTIKTNNVATSYFQTQKKLSQKQARWQDFLAEFLYTLEYKSGKANVVVDALSRKTELAVIYLAKGTILERIKEGLEQDPMMRELVKLASNGKTQRFWVEDGLLYTKGRRIYVPKWDNLRRDLIKECHDTKWVGHPGQKCTMALLETVYFWPHMNDSVELYVKTCLVCQSDKYFVSANQRDWEKFLDVAQFSYNLQWSEATSRSPFKLATGQQPLTSHTLAMPLDEGKSPGATKMAKLCEENADIPSTCLEKARKKLKKWADEKRRHREFSVRDLVLVLSKVGKVSYRLDLPSTLKIHPVFHVSMLKPYHADKEDPSRRYLHRAPPVVTKSYDKEMEMVLTSRTVRKRGVTQRTEYLIKWKGLPESEVTWELAEDLWQFEEHLKEYEATRTTLE
ncbi:hypothetical protein F3Y22_tig00010927pilonHSYRG00153 [Hibiscus syriacus]|uniref:RNA-directed DNA polymerase n=1 Tax=Hibiscus syriacus TaxID=106335 RepID=A0A6A3C4I0_HIBSY|nr:hypothetical protein F3Y22_tig00010927pilonHSYRG00153 [Hibiscus syriacus]